jgi:hypothetical protein
VPSVRFTQAPYSLAWGSSIYARVKAVNSKGISVVSGEGNGAMILTNPAVPVSLANDPGVTSGTQIGLTWTAPPTDGGTPVIDYKLTYAIDQGAY